MTHPARKPYAPIMTRRAAEQALTLELYRCTDAALATKTAEDLARRYKVPLPACARMLLNARQDRWHD